MKRIACLILFLFYLLRSVPRQITPWESKGTMISANTVWEVVQKGNVRRNWSLVSHLSGGCYNPVGTER